MTAAFHDPLLSVGAVLLRSKQLNILGHSGGNQGSQYIRGESSGNLAEEGQGFEEEGRSEESNLLLATIGGLNLETLVSGGI